MEAISKTGLLSDIQRPTPRIKQARVNLSAVATPAPLCLRPFSSVFNPFPYGCSVFCNHPVNSDVKHMLKSAKANWTVIGKAIEPEKEYDHNYTKHSRTYEEIQEIEDELPEELFRRYTDTDSRPMTPTPTVASTRTRASRVTRRCVTPDPSVQPKPKLVLDLRKSHSQETLYWAPAANASETDLTDEPNSSISHIPKWKPQMSKLAQKSTETKVLPSQSPVPAPTLTQQDSLTPVPEEELESEVYRRRGKRKKPRAATAVYQESQEPETQVAAMGADSRGPSSGETSPPAQSGAGGSTSAPSRSESNMAASAGSVHEDIWPAWCSLDGKQLSRLARQLDRETVEAEFGDYRHSALEETLRAVHSLRRQSSVSKSQAVHRMEQELGIKPQISEKPIGWLMLPRTYSRSVSRFELPVDRRLLTGMSPMDYLSRYVVVSESRLQMYNNVFTLYPNDLPIEPNEPVDAVLKPRTMLGKSLSEAIRVALGTVFTEERCVFIRDLIDWKDDDVIAFRLWAGICAVCERIVGTLDNENQDPRDEIERADFESLIRMLRGIQPNQKLLKLLLLIRDN